MATRSMEEAVYVCSGDESVHERNPRSPFYHYGLAVEFYTHFTSPIRRYSDVIVHRLLLQAAAVVKRRNEAKSEKTKVRSSGITLPKSKVKSLLDAEFSVGSSTKDNVSGAVIEAGKVIDGSAAIEEDLAETVASEEEGNLDTAQLVRICHHLNEQTRKAKLVSRESEELFLALYLKEHTYTGIAVVASLRDNGFIAFLPEFHIRAPLYLLSQDGDLQVRKTSNSDLTGN